MRGEEAFFTILGFLGGNLKNIKGVEAPVVTISKSIELLLLQATSIGDEVMEEQEEPSLIYEELEREPPPAFLSQREEEEEKSLLEEEPVLFFDDAEAGQTVAVLDELDMDGRPIAMPANKFLPIDSILAEFTAIDGVRLACLVGRNGFLLASQPEGNKSCKEAVSAIAASGLASTESMGEELARTSLQTGLFEYQDGVMILSPVGEDNFLMLVAEDGANLGWLRLVIRKNTSRIEKINTLY
jgi:predicted regulator of Ras-like GTPase activity (Roadblock/LC7/MglB family)